MAQLIWSPRSLKDLEIICEYIQIDSIKNARYFVHQLIEVAVNTIESPLSGRVVPESYID